MDAFAVTIANTLCYQDMHKRYSFLMALTFGMFQGVMPIIGYFASNVFYKQIAALDHWIALILLAAIGLKMIKEAYEEINSEEEIECSNYELTLKMLIVQAIATSIDALAVGISLSALNVDIFSSAIIIALTTLIICVIGTFIGKKTGILIKNKAEMIGGFILVFIGLKIFIEHLINNK